MHLKVSTPKTVCHSDVACCVCWSSADEIISCSDDHTMCKTNLLNDETTILANFNKDFYPINMSCLTSGGSKSGKIYLVVTSSDGKFFLMNHNGRIDKTVNAHKGAVLTGKWSPDSNALVTSGEDGKVKIWSRSGMLRSTLVQNGPCVYSACWSPESDKVVYTSGKNIVIQAIQPSTKPIKWKAHDELVLKLDWSLINNTIISGGEDCKYKIWDNYGRPLYSSHSINYPITSLVWAPDGEIFSVGSYNSLQLCDKSGWSHGQVALKYGSVFSVSWSSDSTQVAVACADGHVLSAHCVQKRLDWKDLEIVLVSRKSIHVSNIVNDTQDVLEFRDRVIKMSLGFGYLVVITSSQCLIYTSNNFNTPSIFELRLPSVSLVQQCETCFVLVDNSAVFVYSYEGRQICVLKLVNQVQTFLLSHSTLSLSPDVIAIKDIKEEKSVHLYGTTSGRSLENNSTIQHTMQIEQVKFSQYGGLIDRYLVIIDKNRDVYICQVMFPSKLKKLAAMVMSVEWNKTCNMLCGIRNNKLLVWVYPRTLFVDSNILQSTVIEQSIGDSGKNIFLVSFNDSQVCLRRTDGSKAYVSISPYPLTLHKLANNKKFEEAVRLCRFAKSNYLWACLAAMAMAEKKLQTAEVAYAAIKEVDKVEYLTQIKNISNKDIKAARTALFFGNTNEAESILLKAGCIYHIIQLHMDMFEWERALDVAIKNKTHIDTVLGFRQLYLQEVGKKETNNMFKQYSQGMRIEWNKIRAKVDSELKAVGDFH